MIESKTLTIEDLKRDYSGNHGFIYKATNPINLDKITSMCDSLIVGGITEVRPEFTVQLNPNTIIFVWGEGVSFKSGEFYQKAMTLGMTTGLWRVDMLGAFLMNN